MCYKWIFIIGLLNSWFKITLSVGTKTYMILVGRGRRGVKFFLI